MYALKQSEYIPSSEALCILGYNEDDKVYYVHSHIIRENEENHDYVNDEYCVKNGKFFIYDNDNENVDYGDTEEVLKHSFKTHSLEGFLLAKRMFDDYYDPILFSTDIKKLSEYPHEDEDDIEYVILRCTREGVEEEVSNVEY